MVLHCGDLRDGISAPLQPVKGGAVPGGAVESEPDGIIPTWLPDLKGATLTGHFPGGVWGQAREMAQREE